MHVAAVLDEAIRLHRDGKLREALTQYTKILAEHPDNAAALHYSGVVLHQSGEHVRAVQLIRESIRIDASAEAWANLAQALAALDRRNDAVGALQEAARRAPTQADIWSNLAAAELGIGRCDDAEGSARHAVAADPHYAAGWYNLALVLETQGRVVEALDAASRAAGIAPELVAQSGLKAQLQQRLGQLAGARKTLESALARHPTAVPLHAQLADIAEEQGDLVGASRALENVVRLVPTDGGAISQLLFLRKRACDWHDLSACRGRFRAAMAAGMPRVSPFVLLSEPASRAEQLGCAMAWSRQFQPAEAPRRPRRLLSSGRLRVGYLSADFFDHPTAVLAAGLFEQHNRDRFEIVGYSTGPDDGSALRRRVASAFDRFVDAREWPSARLAEQIRADHIDILVDLKGHTAGAPTATLALRPSPIQVQYLGYPGTTGAPYIDYVIGDRIVTPVEHQADYSETLVLLPHSYQVNDRRRAIADPPSREALGLPCDAFVFCCFNNTFKLNPHVLDAWTRILSKRPETVMWLLARGEKDPAIENLRREFGERGVDATRVLFASHRGSAEYLALYRHVDLFLDTWPYNAHTTATDALWSGCPVLTWPGETFASRVGTSLMSAVGLPKLIATSVDDYIGRAIELSADRDAVSQCRAYLLNAGRQSALFDVVLTTRALEVAYQRMAEQHRTSTREPIVVEPQS